MNKIHLRDIAWREYEKIEKREKENYLRACAGSGVTQKDRDLAWNEYLKVTEKAWAEVDSMPLGTTGLYKPFR